MSRICKAYQTRFRWLLQQARARRLDEGVRYLLKRAESCSAENRVPLSDALTRLHERLAGHSFFRARPPGPVPALFVCDAGLGGLARWLRAAGHDALWDPAIDDPDLLRRALRLSAALLTTDSMLMERRAATGDPNGGGAVQWLPYDASENILYLDNNIVNVPGGYRNPQCDFLSTLPTRF